MFYYHHANAFGGVENRACLLIPILERMGFSEIMSRYPIIIPGISAAGLKAAPATKPDLEAC
jgi:hypothetical protein